MSDAPYFNDPALESPKWKKPRDEITLNVENIDSSPNSKLY